MKFYIAALLLLLGCLALMNGLSDRSPDFEHVKGKLKKKIIKQLCRDYGLTCTATGGGNDREGRWKSLNLGFRVKKLMDVDEARVFFVHCMEDLLEIINGAEEMRSSLSNYPFTHENVLLMISARSATGALPDACYVGSTACIKDDLVYRVWIRGKNDDLKDVYQEPYLEALRIVREQEG